MTYYDEKLKALQVQTARFQQLCAVIHDLKNQRYDLSFKVTELESASQKEQADVDRLEGRSLASLFYNAIGRMGEKLSKEREEAYAARLKYDTARRELEAIEGDLQRYEAERETLRGCEEEYQAVLEEKAEAIRDSDDEAAEAILRMEEHILSLDYRKEELQEAIDAGKAALVVADRVLDSLGSAEDWGTFDLLGGGILADSIKYSHLEEAQATINQLQAQLRCFRAELADVAGQCAVEIEVDEFLCFADYFFDSFFADYAVMERIHQAQSRMHDAKDQIEEVLSLLEGMLNETTWERVDVRDQLDLLILETQL